MGKKGTREKEGRETKGYIYQLPDSDNPRPIRRRVQDTTVGSETITKVIK